MFFKKIVILILIFLVLLSNLLAFEMGQFEELRTGSGELSKPISEQELTTATTPDMTGNVPTISSENTAINTPAGTISNIAGSYNLLLLAGSLVGGVLISSADNNAIPALNPLTGDVIIYNMDLGDTVTIDYTGEPAYRAEMSEGVEAEVQTNNKIRFTAYGKDSMFKIKPTEEPSYDFNNGLLEYESDKILEQINTTKENEANVDKSYDYGFKCLTLAADANFNYNDKVNKDNSFSIKNLNKQEYKVCIKKTVYDEYEMVNNRYGLVDLVKDSLKLKSMVSYSKEDSLVYESLDPRNDASLETSLGTTKILIENMGPSSKTISKTYTGSHVITETFQNKEVVRLHEFSKEKHPEIINIYSTSFRTEQPDISINNDLLIQEGNNKFSAFTKNHNCMTYIQSLFDYEGEDRFYEDC